MHVCMYTNHRFKIAPSLVFTACVGRWFQILMTLGKNENLQILYFYDSMDTPNWILNICY